MTILTVVSYKSVLNAITSQKETFHEQRIHNTNFHTHEEISTALPQTRHYSPSEQPWLDLIVSSRGLRPEEVHRIRPPGSFLIQLLHASQTALQLGHISLSDGEDLEDSFPRMTEREDRVENFLQHGKFFVRLDTYSLKDALISDAGHIKNPRDLWTRLVTSARGLSCIKALKAFNIPVYLYLFPWNSELKPEFEYRVFCPPFLPSASPENSTMSISQYRWHSPWIHANLPSSERQRVAERLVVGCKKLQDQILASEAMTEDLRSRGFTFDVVEQQETGEVALIELNDFGALTGCGSCLSNWIRDARVLYELDREEVEVRVCV